MKTDIYLTSTFKHEWNRNFNPLLGAALEDKGISCFLPHRDTDQSAPFDQRFTEDIAGILNSHMVLAVALHESPNWGGEVGFAYGKNIPVIALTAADHDIPLILDHMMANTLRVPALNDIQSYIDPLCTLIRDTKSHD